MKDKRQRLQSVVWPYNMAAVAAAAAADQSSLYAYLMQSTAASLLHMPYSRPVRPLPAAVSSPLSYLAATRPIATPFLLPTGSNGDNVTWESVDYDAMYRSLVSLAAARHTASSTTGPQTMSMTSSLSDNSISTSLFRPYHSLSVGDATDHELTADC